MNSEFQSLPPETQEAVKRTMDTMEPAQTPAEIRETLEGTQKGGVKNSIRNCLTVFQRDPLFRGALRLNLLTEQIDIVKPLGWERTSTTLTDMDMNYLLLYLEENYGLTSEKKVQSAIKIVANENRYHPVRDYLNSLQWDGTERIRYALHHFLGADTDEYTYEALKLFLMGAIRRVFRPGSKFEVMLCLVGGQGAGKSTFFRLLAGRDEWFSDDLKKLDDENVYRKLQGHWIIEMSEMIATANAKSIEEIKSFLSRQKETYKVPYAIQAWEHGWGYVWGTFGNVLTESMLQYKLEQYPDIGASEAFIREHWLGRRTTDCVGLLKGYGWLNPDTLTIDYNTNGMPDYTADQMYASAKENGTEYGGMDTMPDIVGLGLWKQGHWGVYVGNGYAIEAMGTQYGVVRTKVEGRGWQGWCKIPYIQYDE